MNVPVILRLAFSAIVASIWLYATLTDSLLPGFKAPLLAMTSATALSIHLIPVLRPTQLKWEAIVPNVIITLASFTAAYYWLESSRASLAEPYPYFVLIFLVVLGLITTLNLFALTFVDSAPDQELRDILAKQLGTLDLSCPSCNEPVNKRVGTNKLESSVYCEPCGFRMNLKFSEPTTSIAERFLRNTFSKFFGII